MGELVTPLQLTEVRKRPGTIVLATGCYDQLNVGHLRYLRECRKLGDILVVGVYSDELNTQEKGPDYPIVAQRYRAESVAALEPVDYAFITWHEKAVEPKTLTDLKPDILVFSDRDTQHQLHQELRPQIEEWAPWLTVKHVPYMYLDYYYQRTNKVGT